MVAETGHREEEFFVAILLVTVEQFKEQMTAN